MNGIQVSVYADGFGIWRAKLTGNLPADNGRAIAYEGIKAALMERAPSWAYRLHLEIAPGDEPGEWVEGVETAYLR